MCITFAETYFTRNQDAHLMQNKNMPFFEPSLLILKCLELRVAPNSWNTICYAKIDTKILSLFVKNKTIPLFLTSFVDIKGNKIDGLVFFLILLWVLHFYCSYHEIWSIHKKKMQFLSAKTLVKHKYLFYEDILRPHIIKFK